MKTIERRPDIHPPHIIEGVKRKMKARTMETAKRQAAAADKGDELAAQWIDKQKRRHRRGMLPQSEAEALEALPGWTW